MSAINFSIDARTIFQLGKEAIENKNLAVSELVKNSYDADANFSHIFFQNEKQSNNVSKMIFLDNGEGMNQNQIKNNWLRIGTNNKVSSPYTPKGRRKIGEKGIGRLAINRIGNIVEIYSKRSGFDGIYLKIDFKIFEEGLELSNIPIELEIVNTEKLKTQGIENTGTKIIISDLEDEWDEESVKSLILETTKLQAPFLDYKISENNEITYLEEIEKEEKMKTNFYIKVNHNFNIDKTEEEKQLEKFLKYSLFRMNVIVDSKNNTYSYRYSFHPYENMSRLHNRSLPKVEIDKDIIDVAIRGNKKLEEDGNIGEIIIELFAYDFSALVNRNSPLRRITPLKNLVRQNGGVKVYRDNQRVYNYGELGNDWLELDMKRVNRPGRYLSNNVLIGVVKLDREKSSGLVEKTNREGFVQNSYSKKFKKIIQAVTYDFSQLVEEDKYFIKKIYSEQQKKVHSDEIIDNLLNKIETLEDTIPKEDSDELREGVYLCKKQIEYIKSILVNVSMNAMDFYSMFHDLEKSVNLLEKRMEDGEYSDEIKDSLYSISDLISNQNNLLRDRSKKKYMFNEMIEGILYRKKFLLSRKKVLLEKDFEESIGYEAKFNKSSIIRIIDNLIDNSIYWMESQLKDNKLKFETKMINGNLELSISDSGPGFNGDIEFLKEPFVTTKIENEGIGLGLFIVDELIKDHGGYIICDNKSSIKVGGARVTIVFPVN